MKKVTKWLLLVLVIALCMNMLIGCGASTEADTDEPAAEATKETETKQEEPVEDGKLCPDGTSFSMLYSDNASYQLREDWMVLELIKKFTNVDVEMVCVPESDYLTKRQIIMNSGDMPDILTKTQTYEITEYTSNGVLLPISDYEDQMPNYKKFITDFDYSADLDLIRQADGKYYSLPVRAEEQAYQTHIWLARVDLFDELGVESPKTMDDIYDIGVKLKEKYPDSTPITNRFLADNILDVVGPAFGVEAGWSLAKGGFVYSEEKDEWFFQPTTDEYKEMLMYLKKLVDGGVLDEEFVTLDSNVYEQRVMTSKNFILADWVGNQIRYNKTGVESNPDFNVQPIFPPQGPRGDYALPRCGKFTQGWVIPATVTEKDNFEDFLKFVDWFYTEEAAIATSFGVEGETYYIDENGTYQYVDDIRYGVIDMCKEYGINNNGLTARAHKDLFGSRKTPEINDLYKQMTEANCVKPKLPAIRLTADEREEENLYATQVTDFYKQMRENFIFGEASFDEWDAFVAECENKGVAQLRELYNNAWKAQK